MARLLRLAARVVHYSYEQVLVGAQLMSASQLPAITEGFESSETR